MSQSVLHKDAEAIPTATITGVNRTGSRPSLELRVNVEGRDHDIWLPLDALASFGATDREAAAGLREILRSLSRLEENLPLAGEIAANLFQILDATYDLPKKGTG